MLLKVIGAIIVIWIAFSVIGFIFKAIGTLLLVAAVATVGVIAYGAAKKSLGGNRNRQIRG
ncbi:hypothetical protein [Actinokineospora bangkokensis]|uniref:Uncharacterized protein n=1 Tax=Actinokineospora bangkokensis TaxID=1193682 RepID=A0A1Q9LG22_9PSEU|nr:hypothetical protein [Actinokineospora bangkokensis]OLR90899.1 hypothetical protein BJP25_30550 [Actinokineospora bangkokensis]